MLSSHWAAVHLVEVEPVLGNRTWLPGNIQGRHKELVSVSTSYVSNSQDSSNANYYAVTAHAVVD